jgi:DNA invertase Pin-like site-specific DNA recombinase
MADSRRGKYDVVAVWRFDRFARSTSHLPRALEEFQSLSVDFVSLREAIDTSTPTGKMVFTILASVAELERSTIRERVIAGQKAAKRRGVRFGRPAVEVDTDSALKLRKQGLSWRTSLHGLVRPKIRSSGTAKEMIGPSRAAAIDARRINSSYGRRGRWFRP